VHGTFDFSFIPADTASDFDRSNTEDQTLRREEFKTMPAAAQTPRFLQPSGCHSAPGAAHNVDLEEPRVSCRKPILVRRNRIKRVISPQAERNREADSMHHPNWSRCRQGRRKCRRPTSCTPLFPRMPNCGVPSPISMLETALLGETLANGDSNTASCNPEHSDRPRQPASA
jgi:hypothetical protein